MLTQLEPRFPEPTGDPVRDYRQLVAALTDYFRALNAPNVLAIDGAQIDGSAIGANTASTGKFTTLEATTSLTVSGALTDFSASTARIKGDFSNATIASRAMFQTRTTNGATDIGAIADGTGTASAWTAYGGASDPTNSHFIQLLAGATQTIIRSNKTGTGTQRAIEFQIGSTTKMTISTGGDAAFTGVVSAAIGSASAPSYAFESHATTGMYYETISATPTVSIGVGGNQIVRIAGGGVDLRNSAYFYFVNGVQVVGTRLTGYTNAMTGTANRATSYDTSTITLVQLAQRVKAIEDDLTTHGLIGP
jgi:hypothetical protein